MNPEMSVPHTGTTKVLTAPQSARLEVENGSCPCDSYSTHARPFASFPLTGNALHPPFCSFVTT
jgi:hypothetical protein